MVSPGPGSSLSPAPAPWRLRGRGVVAVYAGTRPGALMLVRYAASPVGPYDELLWVSLREPNRCVNTARKDRGHRSPESW